MRVWLVTHEFEKARQPETDLWSGEWPFQAVAGMLCTMGSDSERQNSRPAGTRDRFGVLELELGRAAGGLTQGEECKQGKDRP